MIFVVDTSSAQSAIALLDESGAVIREELHASGRTFDLPERFRALAAGERIARVGVATGPGSFTGLRVGASFAVGLALGLRVPLAPLPTLAIQAARSDNPVMAVSEAGRGRVYFLPPGGAVRLGEASELPRDHPAAGWLRAETRAALEAAGVRMAGDDDLRTFGAAAARLMKSARDIPYESVKLEYMQSFAASSR